jgi:hypothetical protein
MRQDDRESWCAMAGHDPHRVRSALSWLVVVLAGTACQTTTPTTPAAEKSPQESSVMEPAPTSTAARVECGQPFALPAAGPMTLTGQFPAEVAAGEPMLSGTVEATSLQELRGVTQPGADVFLVRDGRIVTTPLPQDAMGIIWSVAAGEAKSLPAEGALAACDSGEPLQPGAYEVYARLMVIPDDGGSLEAFGGPWPLEVR